MLQVYKILEKKAMNVLENSWGEQTQISIDLLFTKQKKINVDYFKLKVFADDK